jgi:hypothetical protein
VTFDVRRTVKFAFFRPMLVQSRTNPEYGPFLRTIRVTRMSASRGIYGVRGTQIVLGSNRRESSGTGEIVSYLTEVFHDLPALLEECNRALVILGMLSRSNLVE